MFSNYAYPPQVAVGVAVGQAHVAITVDGRLLRDRSDGGTSLILNGDALITRTLRDERSTLGGEIMELVHHQGFETVFERLQNPSE